MNKKKNFLDNLADQLFSSTKQLQRIVILTGVLLVLAIASFAGYYYYDRFYQPQPKQAEVSISKAEKAVRDDPQSIDARLNLAEAYMVNRQWNEAINQANTVLTQETTNQHAWLLIGVSNANNGKPADAIPFLSKFVLARQDEDMANLDKQLQSASYYLGDCYLQLGDPQKAITPLEMAVNWSKTDADAMYKLGLAYLRVKDYPNAVTLFNKATTFVPDYLEAYEGMSAAYTAMKEPALNDFALGMVAYSKQDYATARDLLVKSTQEKADSAMIFTGLGQTYERLNELENAKSAYESALKLDPNNFSANNGIQRVEILLKK